MRRLQHERMAVPRDHITIAMNRGNNVSIPWATCDLLLARLRSNEGAQGIVQAFVAVGAPRPVELTVLEKNVLFRELKHWSLISGFDAMPNGLPDLQHALSEDLTDR